MLLFDFERISILTHGLADMLDQRYYRHGRVEVSSYPPSYDTMTQAHYSAEEAGYYLSTYKQFEHKPPDLIKERVDKDYHSVFRIALMSISKVNKTDVETLRTSFGVSTGITYARP